MASADYYPAVIANYGMGAGSAGELFQVLRQKYGYTYGAYSSFVGMNYQNFFQASSSVQSTATKHALELFKEIITDYPDKILDAEKFEKNRNTMLQANTRAYESPGQLLSVLNSISNYGLPFDFVKQRENTLRNITLQQVRDVYRKWLKEEDLIYIVVGDAKRQMNGLESLGLGKPILADREGNILGK